MDIQIDDRRDTRRDHREDTRVVTARAKGTLADSVRELVQTLRPAEAGELAIARFREFPVSLQHLIYGGGAGAGESGARSTLTLRLRYPPKWEKARAAGGAIELPAHLAEWQSDGTLFMSHVDGTVTMIVSDEKRVLTSGDVVLLLNHVCDVLSKRGVVFRGDLCFACKTNAGAEFAVQGDGFSQVCQSCRESLFERASAGERASVRRVPGMVAAVAAASIMGAAAWAGAWTGFDAALEAMFKNRSRVSIPDVLAAGGVMVFGGLLGYAIAKAVMRLTPVRGMVARGLALLAALGAVFLGETLYFGVRFQVEPTFRELSTLVTSLPELWGLQGNNPGFRFAMMIVAVLTAPFVVSRRVRRLP